MDFDYRLAFARNVGWVSAVEQDILRGKRIAIAGLGGVGGSHLVTLARLGVGSFSIADPDRFEIANFNRQPGATCKALGRLKCEVMAELVRDINPTLDLRVLSEGVNERNIDAFLDGVDVYVDGLDFFAFGARQTTFEACARRNIPAVTAAPLGMGGAVVVFMPGGMTFEQYFRIKGRPEFDQAIRLLIGLAPAMLHREYRRPQHGRSHRAARAVDRARLRHLRRDGRRGGAEDPVETRQCTRGTCRNSVRRVHG